MKILLNCHLPFMLAHGGTQVQAEQTKAGLEKIGVEVEYLRWWDESQTGDILHQVGWLPPTMIDLARKKGWKIVMTILLTETCNRSDRELFLRKLCVRSALDGPLPLRLKRCLQWHAYRMSDLMVVGLNAERRILEGVYGLPRRQVAVVPLGLTPDFLDATPATRTSEFLICTGTIGPSKNSLELARFAAAARVPLLFVGKPFDLKGEYWKEFSKLVDGQFVRHHPHVGSTKELIALLQSARGYVLMSRYENWSLAAHEAAACGLPLLLPDQPWARERFSDQASYFPKHSHAVPAALREFYDRSLKQPAPQVRLHSWVEVAEMLRGLYAQLLKPGAS